MPVRIVEWQLPYTWGTGIGIDTNKVISILLREENNLIEVNNDNELYTDLQLAVNITPSSDFPVWVTVGKVLQTDWWTQNGLILNRKTTSGDYARWLYWADGKLYFDWGQGTWKQVYYSSEVDVLIQNLNNKIDALADSLAEVAYTWEYLDTINRPDICVIEISALSNWIGTGTILSGSLIDWSVVDLSLAQGVTGTINEVDVDNKQISLSISRSAVDWMIGIYKEDNSSNYTIYLFDWDAGQAQVNSDWNATSGVAEILNRPAVVNNTTSTSATDVLSANMWKELQDQINNLKSRGRFLSNWNATTGLPTTNPTTLPYQYNSWDYFVVTVVGATNYRPSGTSYTGTASTTVETEEVEVWDMYIFDSTEWLLQINTARTIVVDQALDSTSTNPVENRVITNALGQKQDTLVSGTNIKTVKGTSLLGSGNVAISEFSPSNSGSTGQVLKKTSTWYNWANETSQVSDTVYGSSWDWVTWTAPSKNAVYDKINSMDTTIAGKQATLSAGTGISITSNTVANTWVTSFNGSTWAVTYTAPVTSVNWQTWAVTIEEGNTKVFTISDLTSAASLATATEAYTYAYTTGKCAIIRYSGGNYVYAWGNTSQAWFSRSYNYWAVSSGTWAYWRTLKLTVSSWSVTAIADNTNQINISSSAPSSSTTNGTITLVI